VAIGIESDVDRAGPELGLEELRVRATGGRRGWITSAGKRAPRGRGGGRRATRAARVC
jgi:hypothetical protein